MASAHCLRTYEDQPGPITAAAMTSIGQLAISAGEDGLLRTWTLEPDAEPPIAPIQVVPASKPSRITSLKRAFSAPDAVGAECPGSSKIFCGL